MIARNIKTGRFSFKRLDKLICPAFGQLVVYYIACKKHGVDF